MHVSCQNVTAKRRIVFAQKDRLLNYILKHYGVNSGFMRKKVMNPSFHGHAPGKDTTRAANAATERGVTGENARANAVSGRALSPVLPKEGANGGENNRTSFLRSKVVCSPVLICLPVLILSPALPERVARRENGLCLLSLRQNKNSSFPGHAPGKDTLRAANAATERGQMGENARANAVSGRALSPVKRKRGLRGENGLSVSDYPLSSRHKTLFTITYNFSSLAALSFSRLWV